MCFQFRETAQTSQCPALSAADPTCLTPAVVRRAVLHSDLNMLSAMEMLNKVKISLTVWAELLGLLWKHLFCRNFCALFAGLWKSMLSFWCHKCYFILAGLRVAGGRGNICHFPGGEPSKLFLQQYSLGLSATHHVYSAPASPCSLPYSSFFFFLQPPFPSHHCHHCSPLALPSFAFCPSGFLLLHSPEVPSLLSETDRSIASIISCLILLGLRSELRCLEGYPIAFKPLFLVFPLH